MNRHDFLWKCSSLCLGTGAMSFLLESCSSIYYAQHVKVANTITVHKSEFVLLKGEAKTTRDFVLIKDNSLEFPVCVYRFGENEYTALYTQCTHQGCEIQPHPEYLVCPCHGSEYSNRGKVLNPPAEMDLQQFAVSQDPENIFIHLR